MMKIYILTIKQVRGIHTNKYIQNIDYLTPLILFFHPQTYAMNLSKPRVYENIPALQCRRLFDNHTGYI